MGSSTSVVLWISFSTRILVVAAVVVSGILFEIITSSAASFSLVQQRKSDSSTLWVWNSCSTFDGCSGDPCIILYVFVIGVLALGAFAFASLWMTLASAIQHSKRLSIASGIVSLIGFSFGSAGFGALIGYLETAECGSPSKNAKDIYARGYMMWAIIGSCFLELLMGILNLAVCDFDDDTESIAISGSSISKVTPAPISNPVAHSKVKAKAPLSYTERIDLGSRLGVAQP